MRRVIAAANRARKALDCLTLEETAAFAHISIVDPFSTLIGRRVRFGAGVLLWPGTSLLTQEGGEIDVGAGAEIGGQGGFTLRASLGWRLMVGAGARLSGGGVLSGRSQIGAGAQIIGAIDARDVELAEGGDWRSPDPDLRGAVLKGAGRAFGVSLGRGRVIQAFGMFDAADEKPQSFFHPPAKA
jgi:carbonic anhydrase/acetyltransferase-like protein (isoleucine patch superfamily)